MTAATKKLFIAELRRQWTLAALLAPLLFLAIGAMIILLPERFQPSFNVSEKLMQATTFLLPVISALFCVGLVSNDVRDGWLRTLLVRAIKRQKYLIVKMFVTFTSIWSTLVFAVALPLILGVLISNKEITFNFFDIVSIIGLFVGASLTYVSILAFFSCWLPGVFNVAFLIVWGILASAAHYYVGFALWNKPWAVILEPFIFPSGFFDAIDAVNNHTHVPYSEVLWGLAALSLFLSLSFWSITKIQADKGAE